MLKVSGYKGTLATGGTCIDKVKCLFYVISLVAIKVLSVDTTYIEVSISGLLPYFLSGVLLKGRYKEFTENCAEYIEQYKY